MLPKGEEGSTYVARYRERESDKVEVKTSRGKNDIDRDRERGGEMVCLLRAGGRWDRWWLVGLTIPRR